MKPVSPIAEALPASGIREMMALAAQRDDVIHLEVGEPSFNTPAHIIDQAFRGARAGATHYTPNAGTPSLRQVIAERVTARWGMPVMPDQVIVTTGAIGGLATVLLALVAENDEVLQPDPGWPNYTSAVALCRGHSVFYSLRPDEGYLPNPDRLAALITPRTKAILINNPSNPTGAVFPRNTVEALVSLAAKHDLWVMSDEVYEDLVFDGVHVPAGPFSDRVLTISGCSKSYAMTGWRIGYVVAPPPLVALMAKIQESLVSCASSVSQAAAEAAFRGPQDCVEEMRQAYKRRRDLVAAVLGPAGLLSRVPAGAFYVLLDFRQLGAPIRDLTRQLLIEECVATVPGDCFGHAADGMVRISLAASDAELAEGCRRIRAFAERRLEKALA